MKGRVLLYLLLVATLCVGCSGRGSMCQLERLEAQIDSVPELVRESLDSIPSASLRGEARALYAILRTQADYKCYELLTSDSLIRYATNYYSKSRKSYRAAMAWYSLGCVYTELNNDAAAVEAYLQAQSLFPDTTVRYYRLCYQNLGRHYLRKNMVDEALAAFIAYHNVVEDCDYPYAAIGLAQAYAHKRQPEQAREILEKLLLCHDEIDTLSLETILFELGKIEYTVLRDYDKADAYFDQFITLYGVDKPDPVYWFKGDIAESRGQYDVAKLYYERAMQGYDEVYLQYNCARSLMYLTIDSIVQADLHGYIKLFEQMSDSINRIERRTEIDDIRTAHAMELHQRELAENHRRFMYCATLFVVCLLAVIAIGVLLTERRRKQHYLHLQQELQRNQTRILRVNEIIEENRNSDTYLRDEVLALYRANLTASIALFKKDPWATRLDNLSKLLSKDVPPFTANERTQLVEVLEEQFIIVITNLRDEAIRYSNIKLSTENIHLLIYMALGYSTGVIRECLAASSDNVINQRKKRLAGKLPEDVLVLFAV